MEDIHCRKSWNLIVGHGKSWKVMFMKRKFTLEESLVLGNKKGKNMINLKKMERNKIKNHRFSLSRNKHCPFSPCEMQTLCHGKLEKVMERPGFLKAQNSTNLCYCTLFRSRVDLLLPKHGIQFSPPIIKNFNVPRRKLMIILRPSSTGMVFKSNCSVSIK